MPGTRQNGRRGLFDRITDAMPQNEHDLNRLCDLAEDKLIEVLEDVERAVEKVGGALIREVTACISGLCHTEEEYTYTSTVQAVATGHGSTRPNNENEVAYAGGTEMYYFHPQPRRPTTVSHVHFMADDWDLSRSLDADIDDDADDEHDSDDTENSVTDSDLADGEHNSFSVQDGSNASGNDAPVAAFPWRPVPPRSQSPNSLELPRLWMATYASVGTQTSPFVIGSPVPSTASPTPIGSPSPSEALRPRLLELPTIRITSHTSVGTQTSSASSSTLVGSPTLSDAPTAVGSPTSSETSSTSIPSPAMSAVLVTSDDAASSDSEDDVADYFVI